MKTKQKSSNPIRKRRRPFQGLLATPIPAPGVLPDRSDAIAIEQWYAEYARAQRVKRLGALLDHYDIAQEGRPTDAVLLDLILSLVEEFDIPGFRIAGDRSKGGRPKEWNMAAQLRLLHAVAEAKKRNPRRTEHGACMSLTAPGQPYSQYKADSLYRRFQRIKKESPFFVRLAKLVQEGRSDEIPVIGFRPKVKLSG